MQIDVGARYVFRRIRSDDLGCISKCRNHFSDEINERRNADADVWNQHRKRHACAATVSKHIKCKHNKWACDRPITEIAHDLDTNKDQRKKRARFNIVVCPKNTKSHQQCYEHVRCPAVKKRERHLRNNRKDGESTGVFFEVRRVNVALDQNECHDRIRQSAE